MPDIEAHEQIPPVTGCEPGLDPSTGDPTKNSSLSVIIPVFQNAKTLDELYDRLRNVLVGYRHEILFVDDCSPDGSWNILRRLAFQDSRVAAIRLSRNLGQNRAIMAALSLARGQTTVCLDADLQDPPEAIPLLVDVLAKRHELDAVFAGRRGSYQPPLRFLTSKMFKWSLWLRSAGRLPRDAGLFVAFSTPMRNRLLAFSDPDPYVLELMAAAGLAMRSTPVDRESATQSGYSTWGRIQLGIKAALGPLRRWWKATQHQPVADAISEKIGERFKDGEPE